MAINPSKYRLLEEEEVLEEEPFEMRFEPTAPSAAPPAPASPPPARTLADKYGLDITDALPPAERAPNKLQFLADLNRGISQAVGGLTGTKADTSMADSLQQRGAEGAAILDKRADDLTAFKRRVLEKVQADRAAKADKNNPALSDPNSPEFRQYEAMFLSQPRWAKRWLDYKEEAARSGVVPNVSAFLDNFKGSSMESIDATEGGRVFTQGKLDARQQRQFAQQEKMNQIVFGQGLEKGAFEAELKHIGEARHADHPFREFMPGHTPTPDAAKQVRRNDALAGQINYLGRRLISEMQRAGAIDQKNPLANKVVKEIHQELINIARDKENFGVPSHNDMEQLANMISNPASWNELFSEQGTDSLLSMLANNKARTEIFAQNNGYGVYGQKSGQSGVGPRSEAEVPGAWPEPGQKSPPPATQTPRDRVKEAVLRAKNAAGQFAGAVSGGVKDALNTSVPVREPGGPKEIKVSNGKETLTIPIEDEADAAKDGFKRVQ